MALLEKLILNGNTYWFGDIIYDLLLENGQNILLEDGKYLNMERRGNIPVEGIALDKSSIALTTVGQTEQLTATLSPEGILAPIIWSSSDESVAIVDNTGLVTCVTPGSCTITASCGGFSASCSVIQRKDVYADFLLVGGGGGGGGGYNYLGGGGGGGGGFIECCNSYILPGSYSVVVGAGGSGGGDYTTGITGGDSSFNNITAYGGGGGGGYQKYGGLGASGGGGGSDGGLANHEKGGGNKCSQGCWGGTGHTYAGGGGGGYSGAGCDATQTGGGKGGDGLQSSISGSAIWYSGGGGGGGYQNIWYHGIGGCGSGCGWRACCCYGGGGAGGDTCSGCNGGWAGMGGVFILRYPTACGYSITGGTCYTCGDYTIHCFTSNGTLTVN